MEIPVNKLKKQLLSGAVVYGVFNELVNTYSGELCAVSGYDWMIIDSEHAPFTIKELLNQLQAVSAYDIPVAVRLEDDNPANIKRVLDLGVQTLMIPMVDTPEQAQNVVRATHYAPKGIRGAAPSLTRAARFGNVPDYLKKASDQICLITQVESMDALSNVEKFCRIPEIDCLFIGPTDLATSMGYYGDFTHPEVEKAICKALKKIRDGGKSAGILALDPELAAKYRDHGANMIGVGVDILQLRDGLKNQIGRFL